MIYVVQEQIKRMDALLQAALYILPIIGFHNARNDVERKNLLGSLFASINGECDAHVIHGCFRRSLATQDIVIIKCFDPFDQYPGTGSRNSGRFDQFIVEFFRIV